MSYPKGYHTASGYVGFVSDTDKMFFATEQDYIEFMNGGEQNGTD